MRYRSIICQCGPFFPYFHQQAQACTACCCTRCLRLTPRLDNSVRQGNEGVQAPCLPLGTVQVVNEGPLQAQAGHACRQAGVKARLHVGQAVALRAVLRCACQVQVGAQQLLVRAVLWEAQPQACWRPVPCIAQGRASGHRWQREHSRDQQA